MVESYRRHKPMNPISQRKTYLLLVLGTMLLLVLPLSIGVVTGRFASPSSETVEVVGNVLSIVTVSLLGVLAAIEFASTRFDRDASVLTAIITLCVLLTVVFSGDFLSFLNHFLPALSEIGFLPRLFELLGFLSFALSLAFLLFYLRGEYALISTFRENIVIFVAAIFGVGLFAGLSFLNLEFIGYFVFILLFLVYGFIVVYSVTLKKRNNATFLCIFLIGVASCGMAGNEVLNGSMFPYEGRLITSILGFVVFLIYMAIYLIFILRTTKAAYARNEAVKQVEELQSNILKNQVSPHYIFNALNLIKGLYHTDFEQGDRALDLLSKHLRSYAKAVGVYVVDFETELETLSDFVELEGLKYGSPVNLLYDIESSDFKVPYFSLQPLVENALKYSGIRNKGDGMIVIHAHEEEKGFVLSVSDNGCGFDVNAIGENSYGINNVKERFALLLKANLTIESEIGKGTKIIVFIPKNEGEKK